MKLNFEYFAIQKWILQTVRSETGDETVDTLELTKNPYYALAQGISSWTICYSWTISSRYIPEIY